MTARLGSPKSDDKGIGGKFRGVLILLQQRPRPPRSRALAATLFGGLRPGSHRVHDPCNEGAHGSRLGFPGRRQPRDPAASANVARGLQAQLPCRHSGRRKPDVACLGRNPLLALGDIGPRTSDPEL